MVNIHSQIVPENRPALISVLNEVSVTATDIPDVADNLGVVCTMNSYETAVEGVTRLFSEYRIIFINIRKGSKSLISGLSMMVPVFK